MTHCHNGGCPALLRSTPCHNYLTAQVYSMADLRPHAGLHNCPICSIVTIPIYILTPVCAMAALPQAQASIQFQNLYYLKLSRSCHNLIGSKNHISAVLSSSHVVGNDAVCSLEMRYLRWLTTLQSAIHNAAPHSLGQSSSVQAPGWVLKCAIKLPRSLLYMGVPQHI